MIDTHCHLTFPELAADLDGVLSAAAAAGVGGCITISTTTRDCLTALEIARARPQVWSTAGVHPLYSAKGPHQWENLGRCIADDRCVAWGELGLDNHYPEPAPAVQRAVLDEQLAFIAAVRAGRGGAGWGGGGAGGGGIDKPVVVHCREAFAELVPILAASGIPGERFVFHCFTAGPAEAEAVLALGAMISFTGVVTYKNAESVRQAARLVPADRIMVETDSPYLSPEPVRSARPCRPEYAAITARALAAARGEPWETFRKAIDDNVARFFGVRAPGAAQ